MDGQGYFPPSHLRRLPYFEQSTIGAYRKAGSRRAAWDQNAEAGLLIFARFLCFEPVVSGTTNFAVMAKALGAALDAGCDDPLVNYAALRVKERQASAENQLSLAAYRRVIESLAVHPYQAAVQGWIYASAAAAALQSRAAKSQAKTWAQAGLKELATATTEAGDRETLYDLAPLLIWAYKGATGDRKPALEFFEAELARKFAASNQVALAIGGESFLDWSSEVHDWSSTNQSVVSANKQSFIFRVEQAENLLRASWAQDPTDGFVYKQLLEAQAVQVGNEAEAQKWWHRGRKLAPDYYGVYAGWLSYLESRWHGGRPAALAFGRQLLKEGNWQEQLPFILLDAHLHYARTGYFKTPEVWADLEGLFETYLRLYPNNNVVRSSYCYYAYLAERWDLARRLLDQMGNLVVPAMFRGRYQECLAGVRQHKPAN